MKRGKPQAAAPVEAFGSRLTATQIASLWQVTAQAVGLWSKKEGCPRNRDGTYDLAAVIEWRERKLAQGLEDERKKLRGIGHRDRLTEIKAEAAEFDLNLRRGRYVPIEDVERDFAKLGNEFKAAAEALPRKIVSDVYGRTRPEILATLTKHFNTLLMRLAQ